MRVAPFFAVGALISVADLIFNRSQGVGGFGYSMIERVLIAARAVWFYVAKLLWPVDLGVIHPPWEVRAGDPLGWTALAAVVAVVAVLWLLRRRIGRGPLAGVLFFGVTLSPTLGFVDYNFMLFSFVADRYQYLGQHRPHRRDHRGGGARCGGGTPRRPAANCDGERGAGRGAARGPGHPHLAAGEPLPGRHHLLQPRHRAQPAGSGRASQSRQRVVEVGLPGRGSGRVSRGRGAAPG